MNLYDSITKIKDGEEDPYCERNQKLINIVQFIAEQRRPFFVSGGFALVFSSGKMYRCHKDVDLYFLPQDKNFWLEKLALGGIRFIKNEDRSGYLLLRMVADDGSWLGDIKFAERGKIADDGYPHRVQTNYIGQWVIPTHAPEYILWTKANPNRETRAKDEADLVRYAQ